MERKRIFDGHLTIFKQPRSEFWNSRFYSDRLTKVQTSLKIADEAQATIKAIEWYIQSKSNLAAGLPAAKTSKHQPRDIRRRVDTFHTFEASSQRTLAEYALSQRSEEYKRTSKLRMEYVCKFIGQLDVREFRQSTWEQLKKDIKADKPEITETTLNNYKTAIQIILREARRRDELEYEFRFARDYKPDDSSTSRTFFDLAQYRRLFQELRRYRRESIGTDREILAAELYDYTMMMSHFGTRVGEMSNARFCDFSIHLDDAREVLLLTNIMGKRSRFGTDEEAMSHYNLVPTFRRIVERNGLTMENYKESSQELWTSTDQQRSRAFKEVTERAGLYQTNERVPKTRVLASLRNTYIVFALQLRSVAIDKVAKNCRTSVAKIEKHYAKYALARNSGVNRNYNK